MLLTVGQTFSHYKQWRLHRLLRYNALRGVSLCFLLQVQSYACLYTSKVSNLQYVSPRR
jgi:hypothetical protein